MPPHRSLKRSVVSSRSLDLHRTIGINPKVHRTRLILTVIIPRSTAEIKSHLIKSTCDRMSPRTPLSK